MMRPGDDVRLIQVEGQRLCGLTWMRGLLWYSDAGLEEIVAVDVSSRAVVQRISCPGVRTGLTNLDGRLVQVAGAERELRVLDPDTGLVLGRLENPRANAELCGIEATRAGIWMGYSHPQLLDLRASDDLGLIDSLVVNEEVAGVTAADDLVAFTCYARSELYLVEPTTRRTLGTVVVEGHPTGLTWDGQRFWYCDYANLRLCAVERSRLDSTHLQHTRRATAM